MKIRSIHIDGFGELRSKHYELDGKATLFVGNNEAGKSTMLAFVRAILFGFAPRGGSALRYEPEGGGVHGGMLLVEDSLGKQVRIARYDKGRTGTEGRVTVSPAGETSGGEELLQPLLGGVGSELFRSLFAFGLSELQELRTLQTEELSGYLYSAGLGGNGGAMLSAERNLSQQMDRLFVPRGKNQELALSAALLEQAEADARKSRETAARYDRLTEEAKRADAEWGRSADKVKQLRDRCIWLEKCIGATEHWIKWQQLNEQLEQLSSVPVYPADALIRFEALLQEREQWLGEQERIRIQWEKRAARLERIPEKTALLQNKKHLELLLEQTGAYEQGRKEAAELRADAERLRQEAEVMATQINPDWTESELALFPLTVHTREYVRETERSLAELEHRLASAQAEAQRCSEALRAAQAALHHQKEEAERLKRQSVSGVSFAGMTEEQQFAQLAAARGKLDQWRLVAGQWMEALQQAEHEEREREAELAVLEEQYRLMTRKRRTRLLVVGGLTVTLAVPLYYFNQMWPAAGALFAGGTVAMFIRGWTVPAISRERRQYPGAEPSEHGVQLLEKQLPPLQRECFAALSALTGGAAAPGDIFRLLEIDRTVESAAARERSSEAGSWAAIVASTTARIAAAEAELARLQGAAETRKAMRLEWVRAERSSQELALAVVAAEQNCAAAAEVLAHLSAQRNERKQSWANWLETVRLHRKLAPESVANVLELAEQAVRLLHRSGEARDKAGQLQQETDRLHGRASRLIQLFTAEDDSAPASGDDALSQLKYWRDAAERELARVEERRQLKLQLEQFQQEQEAAENKLSRVEQRISSLWQETEDADEESFRAGFASHLRREQLASGKLELQVLFRSLVSGEELVGRLFADLGRFSREELRSQHLASAEQIEHLEREMSRLTEQRGRIGAEMDVLEQGEAHADKLQRRAEANAQLQRQIGQWAKLAMSRQLFRATREMYELERQPAVLKEAAEHLRMMTGERYVRIVAPIGQQKLLVQRHDGAELEAWQLSRGAAEQLYLSMRFAFASQYARKSAALPLVMDDVLVNFDAGRLARTVKVLSVMAAKHQIVMFTCHDHVREAVAAYFPDCQIIRLDEAEG